MVLIFILKCGTHLEFKQLLSMVSYLPGYGFKNNLFIPPHSKTKVAVETKRLTMF